MKSEIVISQSTNYKLISTYQFDLKVKLFLKKGNWILTWLRESAPSWLLGFGGVVPMVNSVEFFQFVEYFPTSLILSI